MYVKICGVTSDGDAQLVVSHGGSAIGVNLFEGSKRHVSLSEALPWLNECRAVVDRIAVVVNPAEELLAACRNAGCFEAIQFHGNETPEFCAGAGFPRWIKAIRVRTEQDLRDALTFNTPELLLDSYSPDSFGGTGKRLNWDAARDFIDENRDRNVLVAGGLDTANVRDAVRIMRPWGVDVASGVEKSPRSKDPYLVREFIREARSVGPQKSES